MVRETKGQTDLENLAMYAPKGTIENNNQDSIKMISLTPI